MKLSTSLLEAMGFRALDASEQVKGTFSQIEYYSIDGLSFDEDAFQLLDGEIGRVKFRTGLGKGPNEETDSVASAPHTDGQYKNNKEAVTNSPILFIEIGPTKEYIGSSSHILEHEDFIETYNSFPEAREDLRRKSEVVSRRVVASLSPTFSSDNQAVRFLHRETIFTGKTASGKPIKDWRMDFNARMSTSTRKENIEVREKASVALRIAGTLSADVLNFYYSGISETDSLKRFLHMFLCVERLVHSTFSSIEHGRAVSDFLSNHEHIATSAQRLMNEHRNTWTNLLMRFIWWQYASLDSLK